MLRGTNSQKPNRQAQRGNPFAIFYSRSCTYIIIFTIVMFAVYAVYATIEQMSIPYFSILTQCPLELLQCPLNANNLKTRPPK